MNCSKCILDSEIEAGKGEHDDDERKWIWSNWPGDEKALETGLLWARGHHETCIAWTLGRGKSVQAECICDLQPWEKVEG